MSCALQIFTNKHYPRILKFKICNSNHSENKALDDTDVIVWNNIQHHETGNFTKVYLQVVIVPSSKMNTVHQPYHKSIAFPSTTTTKIWRGFQRRMIHRLVSQSTTPNWKEHSKTVDIYHKFKSTLSLSNWSNNRLKVPDITGLLQKKNSFKKVHSRIMSSNHYFVMFTIHTQIPRREKHPLSHKRGTYLKRSH